ncbi:hypothetical protein HYC85_020198 [Camellia sinensis]|uniref:GIGANTEA n=1 Tax=Camellia sinensis TaxID=4442 RepID=A0A7J7GSS0_CAMSI|nr:hypothetical protein HYC85_020198 [Camellia sinensis]
MDQVMAQVTAYVEYFGQFTSEQFPEDIAELIRNRYPSKERRLFDDVLAIFVLHHPEHGHAVILPLISCIIDGTLEYDRSSPPFASFISLVCPSSENEYSEQWALACGEILRILTHYNRPIYKSECQHSDADRSDSGSLATTSNSANGDVQHERKTLRPLSPWITDILLAAPLGIRSDYFRWCGGVMGKYAAGELKPPSTTSRGSGKHPQLMPSTPRWAVANGAGVILSVCDEEVARYETATLTAAAVPALLLPPPTTAMDEHLVAGLPALEPYARLFHRYYAIASPSATQRLLLGLLEAPPSWAPDALDAAVQLVELLRAAEDYATGMRPGIAADAAAALLFRVLSQPALLFPPLRQVEGVEVQHDPPPTYISCYRKQIEVPAAEATIEATAQGIASMLCAHGPEVEWRICTIWEAAYGLIPLSSSVVDLPEIIVATPLQPPILSWNLYIPLLKVLEYLPRGSPSEACLMKIFVATVEAILQRTFPPQSSREEIRKTRFLFGIGSASKNLAVAELRTMVHSLFLESCASLELASRLLFVVLTVCVSHEAQHIASKRPKGEDNYPSDEIVEDLQVMSNNQREKRNRKTKKQGPVAAFDSYQSPAKINGSSNEFRNSVDSAVRHTHRILAILEALFSLKPSLVGTSWSYSSNEIVAAAMVAAHISELFRRSKACMHALSVLMRCKWDKEIHSRASSLYNLIDIHSKAVASIVNKAEPLEAYLMHGPAERELQPWIAKDDDRGQKMWRINQRIVKLIVELMRNHDTPESLVILASASDLLLRATDGMLVDGEACTLPQLELLEATARAIQPVLEWGESGLAVADGLSNLLKCRLPATIRCLSHPSAHVRTLSTSVLRDILHYAPIKSSRTKQVELSAIHEAPYRYLDVGTIDWLADIGKCLTWEAHSRLATGMPIQFLDIAAKELGCTISI